MAKNIFKELIIILLLCIAIILILGVVLYDYVPTNKIVPERVSYSTPQSVKQELKDADEVDEDKVILTYTLDKDDLYNYQRINDYKPGKTNPFSTYKSKNGENNTTNPDNPGSSNPENPNPGNGTDGGNKTPSNNTISDPSKPGGVNPGNYTKNTGLK